MRKRDIPGKLTLSVPKLQLSLNLSLRKQFTSKDFERLVGRLVIEKNSVNGKLKLSILESEENVDKLSVLLSVFVISGVLVRVSREEIEFSLDHGEVSFFALNSSFQSLLRHIASIVASCFSLRSEPHFVCFAW